MRVFDVLDPSLNLFQRYFVEASAGCGKTFSIENAIVRLIIESKEPIQIDSILVLTFTNEATSELKARINHALVNALRSLDQKSPSSFPYLQTLFHHETLRKEAMDRLDQALVQFDLAHIFTIHKFCFLKMKQFLFEARLKISEQEEELVSVKAYETVVRDFFSFYLTKEMISPSQLRLLLKTYRNGFSQLLKSCVHHLQKETPMQEAFSFLSFYEEFSKAFQTHSIQEDVFLNVYQSAAFAYKGAVDRSGVIKLDVLIAIEKIGALFKSGGSLETFDQALYYFPQFLAVFCDKNLKKNGLKTLESINGWQACQAALQENFSPLFEKVCSKENMITLICGHCYQLLNHYFTSRHILTPQNILLKFQKLVQNPKVAEEISADYKAIIIDEFQDTDPVQWDILSTLFLNDQNHQRPFYLVGDPKQAIYSFRKADIYTYLRAAHVLGEKSRVTLNTNYRSSPQLIDALNALFLRQKNWFDLPTTNESLDYTKVLSSPDSEPIDDYPKGAMHFLMVQQKERSTQVPSKAVEEDILFPYMVNEILRLSGSHGLSLSSFAILVRDRFQGARLKNYLKKHSLPFATSRPESLQGLGSIKNFYQIYEAVLNPHKMSLILALKLNPILGWPQKCYDETGLIRLFDYFSRLKKLLLEQGFLAFYHFLVDEEDIAGNSLYQRILSTREGIYLHSELEQIKDLMVQEELSGKTPTQLLKSLDQLSQDNTFAEKTHPLRQNFEENALKILTLHMSKGLEFDVVFALGLANQSNFQEELVVKEEKLVPRSLLSSLEEKLYTKEQDAEKLRQLYVALTRAKKRVYIPYVVSNSSKVCNSALDLFFDKVDIDFDSLQQIATSHPQMSYTLCENPIEVNQNYRQETPSMCPPQDFNLSFIPILRQSFTSQAAHLSSAPTIKNAPVDFEADVKDIHTLPAGTRTGTLWHQLLEDIDFQNPPKTVKAWTQGSSFEPWTEIIDLHLEKLLHTPIAQTFCLKDLKSDQILKEVEFLYPTPQGVMQGYIDLVIFIQGNYYLLDYKTNWLKDYSQSSMTEAMQEHDYTLQEKIYKEALKKYLKTVDSRPFEECFKGSIYWFIRGVGEEGNGLIHLLS